MSISHLTLKVMYTYCITITMFDSVESLSNQSYVAECYFSTTMVDAQLIRPFDGGDVDGSVAKIASRQLGGNIII